MALRIAIADTDHARQTSERVAALLPETPIEFLAVPGGPDDLRARVLAGECTAALHSSFAKLPPVRVEGLSIVAVPFRDEPRSALLSRRRKLLRTLTEGATLATREPVIGAQVSAIRSDIDVRLLADAGPHLAEQIAQQELDAVILPHHEGEAAGDRVALHTLGIEELLPPAAQGVCVLECRSDDEATRDTLAPLDDATVRAMAVAERTFQARILEAGDYPVAALAQQFGTTIKLHGLIVQDGRILRSRVGGQLTSAIGLGGMLATELLALAGQHRA